MADPQGLVSYPGLTTFARAEYVLSQGITPGTCMIEMPQELLPGLARAGNLVFSYADQQIALYDCILSAARIDRGLGGFIARVEILDRRWKWRYGFLSGHYNLRLPTGLPTDEGFNGEASRSGQDVGRIRFGTEKTPQELAALCLEAMNEQGFDVSALPNDARPEISWSYTNPARALQELCEQFGCRVVLWLEENSVRIVRVGAGNPLPDSPLAQWVSEGANPPESPGTLTLVGGPTVYQGFLPLRAVGLDLDGSVRSIDELSYTPTNGWRTEPLSFPSVGDPAAHRLAETSLYRMWSLAGPDLGLSIPTTPNAPPLAGPISPIQIRLFDHQLDTHTDPDDPARIIHKKPELWGEFSALHAQEKLSSETSIIRMYRDFIRVDPDRWLIMTDDPLYLETGGIRLPARLWVKIAYSVRSGDSWEPVRYTLSRTIGDASNTPPQPVYREDIFLKVVGIFDEEFGLADAVDNFQVDAIQDEANYYLDAAEAEYLEQDSIDVPYAGVVPIQVDGLIQQVTYSIISGEGGGTTTRASLATEHNAFVLPYKRRAQLEHQAEQQRSFTRMKHIVRQTRSTAFPGSD